MLRAEIRIWEILELIKPLSSFNIMVKVVPTIPSSSRKLHSDSVFSPDSPLYTSSLEYRQVARRSAEAAEYKLIFISDPLRVKWDIVIILLAVYNCLVIPYRISFNPPIENELLLNLVDIIVDLFFIVDIVLNFRTSYIDIATGELVTKRAEIARNYIKNGRLLLDLIASIPIDLFTLFLADINHLALIKLVKLIRVLRLSKIIYYMKASESVKTPVRMAKLILFILLYLHLLSCGWNMLVSVEKIWVPVIDTIHEDKYRFYDEDHWFRYLFSLYIAINTLVGSEILPLSNTEVVFCMISILIGALLFSYMLGEIAVLVIESKRYLFKFFKKLDKINMIMRSLKLSEDLQLNITDYFFSTYRFRMSHSEWKKFREIVPQSFIKNINQFLYEDILKTNTVFKLFPDLLGTTLEAFDYNFLTPDTNLIGFSDESEYFYVVVSGKFLVTVEAFDHTDYIVRELNNGDYCGEIGLIYNVRRTAQVKAIRYCNVGMLDKEAFLDILKQNPDLKTDMKTKITSYNDPYRRELIVISI